MPFSTDIEKQAVFDAMVDLRSVGPEDDLPYCTAWSFNQAVSLPNTGSWFAWNRSARNQLPQFFATKALEEFYLDSPEDPDDELVGFAELDGVTVRGRGDPQAELRRLKALGGGLPLSYKLKSTVLYQLCKIMYCVTLALWEHYAAICASLKTPLQTLKEHMRLADGWKSHKHLTDMVRRSLLSTEKLVYMEVPLGSSLNGNRVSCACFNC